MKKIFALIILWLLVVAIYQTFKPLPDGVSTRSSDHFVTDDQIKFLTDKRYETAEGDVVFESEIFEAILAQIDAAESLIVADMFLLNPFMGQSTTTSANYRDTSQLFVDRLIEKKQSQPNIHITLVTDPINTVYGSLISEHLDTLRNQGINVYTTDLTKLRDSNALYSSVWRSFIQWFGNSTEAKTIDNPMHPNGEEISLRGFATLLNFKANHRKLIVTDSPDGLVSLVTSANPHSASSVHNNVAVQVKGLIGEEILAGEREVQAFSDPAQYDRNLSNLLDKTNAAAMASRATTETTQARDIQVNYLTESKIYDQLLEWIDAATYGDEISIAQFYVSERKIINKLVDAASRGVTITMVLDPNSDAFGIEKSGMPNRMVASELRRKGNGRIRVRWYQTHGEQFHSKLFLWVDRTNDRLLSLLGSANFSRRNLKDFNLEANIAIQADLDAEISQSQLAYFEDLWGNTTGRYTLLYEAYEQPGWFAYWRYRLMEMTGLSTF